MQARSVSNYAFTFRAVSSPKRRPRAHEFFALLAHRSASFFFFVCRAKRGISSSQRFSERVQKLVRQL